MTSVLTVVWADTVDIVGTVVNETGQRHGALQ